jgi:sulfate/thiosulfate-binding protein
MFANRRSGLAAVVLGLVALMAGPSGCKRKDDAGGTAGGGTPASGPAGTRPNAVGPLALRVASYDPTRELYKAFNPAFAKHWKETTGQDVTVETFHGPSGTQAQAIVAGNEADVAALSVAADIDRIAKAGLTTADWRAKAPNGGVPYTSAVVFMVRKGNPKAIKDWEDLARGDVTKLAPDPKTGGGARWIYLAAWAHALRKSGGTAPGTGDEAAARAFVAKVYDKDKAICDPAMRGSTTRFVRGEGDVLFGWENEILQAVNDPAVAGKFEVVLPSDSIVIEVPIAVVDNWVDRKGTRSAAEGYVKYLYSEAGQELVAKFYNRPTDPKVAERHKDQFPPLTLYKFADHFKDWQAAAKQHFDAGGELDKIRAR